MELTQEMIAHCEKQNWDDDLRQEVYKKVLASPVLNTHVGWLNTIYHNLVADLRRSAKLHGELKEEYQHQIANNLGHNNGEGVDPLEGILMEEGLRAKLKLLSPLLLQTLIWINIDGLSVEDIAVAEGVEPNVIYQRIHQAKKILQGVENE